MANIETRNRRFCKIALHGEVVPHTANRGRLVSLFLTAAMLAGCGSQSTRASDNVDAATTASGAAANIATAAAAAPASTALPPAAAAAWESFARGQCRDQGERFGAARFAPLVGYAETVELVERLFAGGKGGFVSADFNADGKPDFVVTTPAHGCVASGPAYGDQGPPVDFIVSTAGGYKAFDGFMGWMAPAMIVRRGDRDVLDLPGGFNGRCGIVTKVTWGWTGGAVDVVERRNDHGQLVDREGCAQPAAGGGATAASPIEAGFYSSPATYGDCAEAIRQQFFYYWDGSHIEALGGNRYRVTFRGIEEAKVVFNEQIVTVNSRTSVTDEYGARWTHCPASQVSRSARQELELE